VENVGLYVNAGKRILPRVIFSTIRYLSGRSEETQADIVPRDLCNMNQESAHSTATRRSIRSKQTRVTPQCVSLSFAATRLSNTDTRNTAVLIGLRDSRMKTPDKYLSETEPRLLL
jgi:hypothetical protein